MDLVTVYKRICVRLQADDGDLGWTRRIKKNTIFVIEYEPEQKRQLYAFPRVGRSELPLGEPIASPARRAVEQGGMWFGPRVGRSEPIHQDFQPMPVRRHDQPGMWFGPRLGRSFKSEDDGKTLFVSLKLIINLLRYYAHSK